MGTGYDEDRVAEGTHDDVRFSEAGREGFADIVYCAVFGPGGGDYWVEILREGWWGTSGSAVLS